jgi:hypothetical protein
LNPIGLILLALVGAGGFLWLRRQPPQDRNRAALKLALLLILLGLLFLAITGRLHWLGALVALLLPIAQRLLPLLVRILPWLSRLRAGHRRQQNRSGQSSTVRSRMILMTLDHDSGDIDGEVLEGPFSGQKLSALSEAQFIELLQACRASDQDSARLLETYLDKRFGQSWREDDPGDNQGESVNGSASDGQMTEKDALDILGLEAGADRDAIVDAHRRLMQRNHPDRGGSAWLAARINEAKSVLLGKRSG